MARVGHNGQVVIDKAIRDALGIQPGWLALQCLVEDHVEIIFLPPDNGRSLKGRLSGTPTVVMPPGDAWAAARERAWATEVAHGEDGEPAS